MDAELHVTTGSYLSQQGFITEAEGDQPGTLAALHRDIVTMGFKPLVYGNLKGFLNHYPTLEEMQHWSSVQGISLEQVTGFTDGTKLQIEQVLVANGLGAKIAIQGMYGYISEDIQEGSIRLAEQAKEMGAPISDYLLCHPQAKKRFPAGVFITAEYDHRQAAALRYLKLGDGPFYTLIRNYHLCHLEIPKTIRQVIQGDGVLLNNSDHPSASVAVISKTLLKPGTRITRSGRNFLVRGEAIPIDAVPNHVPIGLMSNAVITRAVEPGQMILFDDVEIPDSLAYQAWKYSLNLVKNSKMTE
jgi:predicted homoserine dehydrogenase-like protein